MTPPMTNDLNPAGVATHRHESSGYVWEHGNDWDSGPWSIQTNEPCSECGGTGMVEAEPITLDDLEEMHCADRQ